LKYAALTEILRHVGKDPARLVFEDELTGINNRRFLLSYLEHEVDWRSGDDFPLSLLSVDLDHFKQVNDAHGHDTGDRVLNWVATLISSVGGDEALPVRFGGDEFLLLLPGAGRPEAQAVADRLLQSTQERPFRDGHSGLVVPLTVSVGFAVAPDDAVAREDLIQAADAALYYAKQSGRNRATSVAQIDQDAVFKRTAMQRLTRRNLAGRTRELEMVDEALAAMGRGQSQILVFQGEAGAGKTTLLDTVRRSLRGDKSVWLSRVSGDPREARRPYYLAARVLIDLLGQNKDSAGLLEDLSAEERSHLAHVIPAVMEGESPSAIDRNTRRGIFTSFVRLVRWVVKDRPLIVLADDLHFADEATLALLHAVVDTGGVTLVLCGTASETLRLAGESGPSPLEHFLEEGSDTLAIRGFPLAPFTATDVTEYLQSVFPNVETPPDFESDLVRATNGNPSFIAEIVRGLVGDGKVRLEGQTWVISVLDEAYLTRSVEEIVTKKIAALDKQDRELLERASTLGENIPVSILAGSADVEERNVQAFLERAEALGLVSLDFHLNDEVMHFLGKRVLEISYTEIDEGRRRELHEEIGRYHEQLSEGRFAISASMLAYHFRRAANEVKAQKYEEIHRVFSESVFELGEVDSYRTDASPDDDLPLGDPLDEATTHLLPGALRLLLSAVRNTQLYPPESAAITHALEQARESVHAIVSHTGRLTLTHSDRTLLVNGQEVALPGIQQLVASFLDLLSSAQLSGLSLAAEVTLGELRSLLTTVGAPRSGGLDRDFWRREVERHGLQHIELRQTQYARVVTDGGGARDVPAFGSELAAAELLMLADVLRDLLKTASQTRLYPMGSDQVVGSLKGVLGSLSGMLARRPVIALSRVESYLLVNGARIDVTRWQSVADGFIRLLRASGLVSLTFKAGLNRAELERFFEALRSSGGPRESGWWERFGEERGLTGILFNRESYAVGEVALGDGAPGAGPGLQSGARTGDPTEDATGSPGGLEDEVEWTGVEWSEVEWTGAQQTLEVPGGVPPEALGVSEVSLADVHQLLLAGSLDVVRKQLKETFASWLERDPTSRREALETCVAVFRDLPTGLRRIFADLAQSAFAPALEQEVDPEVLHAFAAAVFEMGAAAIQFSDHQLAVRLFGSLTDRRRRLEEAGAGDAVRALDARGLDEHTQQLLVDDLRSGSTPKMSHASLVLGRLGPVAIPPLVMVIKNERELRIRQLAAGLLTEVSGAAAAEVVKREILTEALVEHRYRLLEVADIVTEDLRTELAFCLVDENAKIRRAAFQLFERLGRDDLVDLMQPLALGEDSGAAKGAIRSLAVVGTPAAAAALVGILKKTKVPGVAMVCCKAVGSLKPAAAVPLLESILKAKKLFGYAWDEDVRAEAALALRLIATADAWAVLEKFVADPSARIREVAKPRAFTG
jgi:diguanylate cyclase (GGDEF)-like protein